MVGQTACGKRDSTYLEAEPLLCCGAEQIRNLVRYAPNGHYPK
jgi:hypothetical protein